MKFFASKIIVDDVLLYGRTSENLLDYFRTVLDALKHHYTTLKIKKAQMVSIQVQVFKDECGSGWDTTFTVQK